MEELPTIPGYEILERLGEGSCGTVFRARLQRQDRECAVKVFEERSINRQVLSYCLGRVFGKEDVPHLLELIGGDLNNFPFHVSMALAPRSLATDAPAIQGAVAWRVIDEIATALAALHRLGVTHGNLTFENVRIGGDADPVVNVADIATGLVCGVEDITLDHHLYYLPPEQLRMPDRMANGKAERWDVYSFGVVAFRLLTGNFPRGEPGIAEYIRMSQGLAPSAPGPRPSDFAAIIEQEVPVTWPAPASDKTEVERRAVVDRCLALAPGERFADMRDVAAALGEIEHAVEVASARKAADSEIARARRRGSVARTLSVVMLALFAGAAATGYFLWERWQQSEKASADAMAVAEDDMAVKETVISQLEAEMARAVASENAAERRFDQGKAVADELFRLALLRRPTGGRERATFDLALGGASNLFETAVESLRGQQDPAQAVDLFRSEHNFGEILLIEGRDDAALEVFQSAAAHIETWLVGQGASADADMRASAEERLARVRTASAEILREQGLEEMAIAEVDALESALGGMLAAGPASDTLRVLTAGGHLLKGELLAEQSDDAGAVAAFRSCIDSVGGLAGAPALQDPDGWFHAAVAAAATARLQVKMNGATADTVAGQVDAVEALLALTGQFPDEPRYEFALAHAYGDLGRGVSSIGNATDASRAHTESVKILADLVKSFPGEPGYRLELALEYGEVASIVRDNGQTERALEYQAGAVAFLEDLSKKDPGNLRYTIELSRQEARKAELLNDASKRPEAILLLTGATERIESLCEPDALDDPFQEEMRRVLAELYGALGHATEEAKNKSEAIGHFSKAVESWKLLADRGGDDASVAQGLAWCQQRLERLQP